MIPKHPRAFRHYTEWEDYRAGMYVLPSSKDHPRAVVYAARLLSKPQMFFNVALRMIDEWQVAAQVHLSNPHRNRQAWIGQASCCFAYEIPEYQTKQAWNTLSERQQILANSTADDIIRIWESTQITQITQNAQIPIRN